MAKRRLEDLNLLDDFLFGTMVSYPEVGEAFVREVLQIIFRKKFGQLTIVPQKVYLGSDTDMQGARLDVYLEEKISGEDELEAATVYDMEPDKNDRLENRKSLPKRTRFYHAKIDAASLNSGENYKQLKNVVVIMITPYDPFNKDYMVYTVKNMCEELPDMPYDDGTRTLYLYTKGKKGTPSQELRQLLQYMENTTEENAKNNTLLGIHQMVNRVKRDKGVSLEYMKIFEREQMLREEGREEERVNTEREKQRADQLADEVNKLREELFQLKEELNRKNNEK